MATLLFCFAARCKAARKRHARHNGLDGAPHVSGFDTPEIGPNADCDKERILGVTAAKRFQDLLLSPGVRIYDSGERDKTQSKRRLVWVVLPGGRTAGSILIEEGHARVWKPRHKNNWCD